MEVREKFNKLTKLLIEKGYTITTMESCTSGQLASLITDTEGSSAVLKGACITYSNEAKIKQGVDAQIIDTYGVYSKETAVAMAKACLKIYPSSIGIGVTGSMGNVDPNNADSVPGEVYFAIVYKGEYHDFYVCLPECASRLEYKLVMCDYIVNELFKLLKN